MPTRSLPRVWVFLLFLVLLIGGLWAASDRPPRLPADRDHAVDSRESRCLECHAHSAQHPRPTDHPPRDDCFSCHKDATGTLHPRRGAPTSVPGGWESDPRLR